MVGEELAVAAIAAAVLLDDDSSDAGEYTPPTFKPDAWRNRKQLASYNVDGGKVTIFSQSTPKGTVSHGVERLAAVSPQGLRFPDESAPGVLTQEPSGRTYQPDEIQQVADDWVAAIPPKGPTGPVGPQPGPSPKPGRPQLPGGGLAGVAAAGRYGDSELVHVNEEEVEMLIQQGGSGTRNPTTGLREFFTPNTSTNIKNQIEAYLDGEASCFDLVDGNSPNSPFQWVYSDGGNVLQLDDDDFVGLFAGGFSKTSATLALRIAAGYSLRMVCYVEGGFVVGNKDSGTRDVFAERFLTQTKTGDIATFVMTAGDIIQIDIDGHSSIGDFIITSEGTQITKSVNVDNDVFLTIQEVTATGSPAQLDIDDLDLQDAEVASSSGSDNGRDGRDDDEEEEDGEGGLGGFTTVLVLSTIGLLTYFVFQNPVMSFRGSSRGSPQL